MKSKIIGGICLILAIGIIVTFQLVNKDKPKEITVSGYLGGEKIGLLEDEEVKEILKVYFFYIVYNNNIRVHR